MSRKEKGFSLFYSCRGRFKCYYKIEAVDVLDLCFRVAVSG